MAETLFHCEDALWTRFAALCRSRDETPGAVLRNLVRLEVKRADSQKARTDEVIDEQLLVRLRLLVAEALSVSESWALLQTALNQRGLRFVASGGGLLLTTSAPAKRSPNPVRSARPISTLSAAFARVSQVTRVPALRRRRWHRRDRPYAACTCIDRSRIGRCTSAENAPTPTPIHQTKV